MCVCVCPPLVSLSSLHPLPIHQRTEKGRKGEESAGKRWKGKQCKILYFFPMRVAMFYYNDLKDTLYELIDNLCLSEERKVLQNCVETN